MEVKKIDCLKYLTILNLENKDFLFQLIYYLLNSTQQ